MVEKVPMTQGGFSQSCSEELRWRQQEERPRIIEAIAEARDPTATCRKTPNITPQRNHRATMKAA